MFANLKDVVLQSCVSLRPPRQQTVPVPARGPPTEAQNFQCLAIKYYSKG